MKNVFLFLIIAFRMGPLRAQITINTNTSAIYNAGGRAFPFAGAAPASNTKYIDLKDGSPFFNDSWSKAKLVSKDGKVYQDITVKLDLLENRVHYKDSSGKELVIGTPLRELHLQQTNAKNTLFISGDILPNPRTGWYMLLVNDTLTLLKWFTKTFEQHTSYGSATEYTIKTQEHYLVYLKDQAFEIKKPVDFGKVLPALKAEIDAAIKRMNNNLSKDEQLTTIATYCNTLLRDSNKDN
jgi:hypothetical protein